jgi:hypothetical protein
MEEILKKRIAVILLMVAILTAADMVAEAQDGQSSGQSSSLPLTDRYWISLGAGVISYSDLEAFMTGSLGLSYSRRIHVFSGRVTYGTGVDIFSEKNDKFSAFDLMYGVEFRKEIFSTAISTGINYNVHHDWKLEWYPGNSYWSFVKFRNIGIPLDIRFSLAGKRIGVGLDIFTVFNEDFTSFGGSICIQYGRLR